MNTDKVAAITRVFDDCTTSELQQLQEEIERRLSEGDGIRAKLKKQTQHFLDRHITPIATITNRINLELGIIVGIGLAQGQGKDQIVEALDYMISAAAGDMQSLKNNVVRAQNEGIAFESRDNSYFGELLREAQNFYTQPLNNGSQFRTVIGQFDEVLKRVIEFRSTTNAGKLEIDHLCERMHSYKKQGVPLTKAFDEVIKDLGALDRNEDQEADYMYILDWSFGSAEKAYRGRYGSSKTKKTEGELLPSFSK